MTTLDRSLGLPGVVAISIGAMLGGEIFFLPAVAAGLTGASLWLAYLIAALLVVPAALTKAELATAIPSAGGSYLFVERAMGPMAGTLAGIGLWLSLLLKSAFALAVLGSYLALVASVPTTPVAMLVLVGVVALNVKGVRKVGRVQTVVVAACLFVLATLVIAGGPRIEALRVDTGSEPLPWLGGGVEGLLAAVGLVFISYAGVTKIAAIAEEVEDEARNIPLGIMISLLVIAAVYTAVAWVLAGIFPADRLVGDATPIASLAGRVLGPIGVPIIAVTAVAALISMANAGLLAASRFPLAMARDRLVPGIFGRVHPRHLTPVHAIVLTGAAMAVIVATFDVIRIAKLASAFMIAAFVVVNLTLILFRESKAQWYEPRFVAPLYPLTQIVGIATGLLVLAAMGLVAIVGILVICAAGLIVYLAYGRRRASRLGILRQIMRRRDLEAKPSGRTGAFRTVEERATIVALFGSEPSPEALVQIGITLAGRGRVEVMVLREVPEQTDLGSLLQHDDRTTSLQRRVLALAKERDARVHFDVVVSRDVRRTLYERANQLESQWVVMAWRDRSMRGLIVRNPLAWLDSHLPCNLAIFRDAGIRTYRRVMAVAEPGPHDVLVTRTADELASLFRAEITFVNQAKVHGGDDAAATAYLEQMRALCRTESAMEIHHGDDDVADFVHASARFDLVILGAPPERPMRSMFLSTREEKVMEGAHCAVLRLKTPRAQLHGSLQTAPPREATAASVLDPYLVPGAIAARITIARKDRLFAELAEVMARGVPNLQPRDIELVLRERESLQSTAMGHGLAIPHATHHAVDRTHLAVITLARPVEFGEGKGEPVDVCFCLLGPPADRTTHLHLLAAIAKSVLESDLLDRMRRATTPGELARTLTQL